MDPHHNNNIASTMPLLSHDVTSGRETRGRPPISLLDIGISDDAYLFRVSLPGIRENYCNVSCNIQRDGSVIIRRDITRDLANASGRSMGVYRARVDQFPSPGQFTLSFKLPGPVDPRLFAPTFRTDGILEGVVLKFVPQ